jgi:hypothetical protein
VAISGVAVARNNSFNIIIYTYIHIIKPKVGAEEVLYDLPTPYYIEETYMGQRK